MSAKRISQEDKMKMMHDYVIKGMKIQDIADKFGCHRHSIGNYIKKENWNILKSINEDDDNEDRNTALLEYTQNFLGIYRMLLDKVVSQMDEVDIKSMKQYAETLKVIDDQMRLHIMIGDDNE